MKLEQVLTHKDTDLRAIAKVLVTAKLNFSYTTKFQNCNRKHFFAGTYNNLPISICYKENLTFFTTGKPGCRWVSIRYHSLIPAFSLGAPVVPQQTFKFMKLEEFLDFIKGLFEINL